MCVMAQMETCGGATHHFKLNTLVSGKLLYSLSGGWISDLIGLCCPYCHISLSCCFALTVWCVCVCVFPGPTVSPPSDFAHYGLCAHTQHAPVFIRDNCIRWCWEYEKIGNDRFSPFFTAVVEFPNYVITLSVLRPSRSEATADSASLYYSGSQTRRERFLLSLKMYIKRRQPHPGGQRSVPREAECACCLRSRHPPEWRLCDGSQFLLSRPWQLWHR